MKTSHVSFLATGSACVMLSSRVQAMPIYVPRVPNGANVPGVTALGHEDNTGDDTTRNVFGIAFEEAGMEWTKELCEADSDEDGQTNGQELGDPCCVWKEGGTPQWKRVSHPGDDTKTSDASMWAQLDCDVVRAQAEAKAAADAEAEASKTSPDGGEDSEVDISMGNQDSSASTMSVSVLLVAIVSAVLQMLL
ncbi:Cleavage induced protein [Phytophthora megakarya]|uniref:Cleavage induced protein n=1 Tax=Phytophthora megakarya TaxID=4795 RepID=A0A225WW47_9STRA|nr:Cleavage induced protein [Phytophthora megakarya]